MKVRAVIQGVQTKGGKVVRGTQAIAVLPQDNGCFNTLELRDGSWTVRTVNEVPG